MLAEKTAGAEALFTEHPFVLKRDEMILDGTIDLLARFSNHPASSSGSAATSWKIFHYKFSNESSETALATYEPQLAAYKEAVEKLNPGAEVSALLVLIGEPARVVTLPV